MRHLKALSNHYPFSFWGTVWLAGSCGFTAYGKIFKVETFVLLGGGLLVFLLSVVLIGQIFLYRFSETPFPRFSWETPPESQKPCGFKVDLPFKTPPFFRLHLRMKASLSLGEKKKILYLKEFGENGTSVHGVFRFPLSGLLISRSRLILKDILGLSRASLSEKTFQDAVRSRLLPPGDREQNILSETREERKKHRQKSDALERYHSRDYKPGDRLRDINWKSSRRIGKFIVRDAYRDLHQGRNIIIILRNRISGKISAADLAAWDLLKSVLISFIRDIRESQDNISISIYFENRSFTVRDQKEFDSFRIKAASFFYARSRAEKFLRIKESEDPVFIFTTARDRNLKNFLSAGAGEPYGIFRTEGIGLRDSDPQPAEEIPFFFRESLYLGFPNFLPILSKVKPQNISSDFPDEKPFLQTPVRRIPVRMIFGRSPSS